MTPIPQHPLKRAAPSENISSHVHWIQTEHVFPALLNHQTPNSRLLLAVGILVPGSAMLATTRTAHPASNAHLAPTRTRLGAPPLANPALFAKRGSGTTDAGLRPLGVGWLGALAAQTHLEQVL